LATAPRQLAAEDGGSLEAVAVAHPEVLRAVSRTAEAAAQPPVVGGRSARAPRDVALARAGDESVALDADLELMRLAIQLLRLEANQVLGGHLGADPREGGVEVRG